MNVTNVADWGARAPLARNRCAPSRNGKPESSGEAPDAAPEAGAVPNDDLASSLGQYSLPTCEERNLQSQGEAEHKSGCLFPAPIPR